ncbi:MAG: hypothetical protein B7Z66_02645 [Chromatiales bacterium 21-64-14]|nr:MAG: hypothetical protein B7Z66_02645 [Chromatiales bacterium 21-64-14]HQU14521.1 class I adenylate cyclase [Gammaproteobacteria bacterium]
MVANVLTHRRFTDDVDLRQIKRRFYAINRERLQRLRGALRPRQRSFLDMLPLLFHTNHALLPGYVSKQTPYGISDYSPAKRSVEAAHQLARSFQYQKRALPSYQIFALYLMGSSGTIAYSEKSDFDVWVCHHPGLNRDQRTALRRKAQQISQWARSLALEVHFFIIDAERFRNGGEEPLSTDSSGNIQHQLLLDEFYRTGLLLAGRFPVWWLVPPEAEAYYDDYVRDLKRRRFVHANEDIDFGGLAHIPPGEFLGASLWQLYKAIDSPYKSMIKILLMEAYATEYPNVDLLSLRFKRAVYEGETDLDRLDPYVMMAAKVEEHLRSRGDQARVELSRRCFYFKVNERLSEPGLPSRTSHRREVMRALTREWGWTPVDLHVLDTRASWKIHRVLEERRMLVDQLTGSYRMLSDFAREHGEHPSIDPLDLNTLGRKLYAAFERKAGKIEFINPGISSNLVEERLTIHQAESGTDQQKWLLFRDEVDEEQARRDAPLKRAHGLVELLTWCYFNKLVDHGTVIGLHTRDCEVSHSELHGVLGCLHRSFPTISLGDARIEELARSPRVLHALLFVNLGIDPMAHLTRQGMHLTSNRTDALCYGGRWENLSVTFDLVVLTSWQEVLTFRYCGENALLDCLCDYLAWAPQGSGVVPRVPATYCLSSTRGSLIGQRIEGLFQDVVNCFYGLCKSDTARYVLRVGHRYYVLQPENRVPRWDQVVSLTGLLDRLAAPQDDFSPVIVDPQTLRETPLPLIFETNRPGVVQFFYHLNGDRADIYVVDERASLFHQALAFDDETALLSQFQRFLEAVRHRRAPPPGGQPGVAGRDEVEYYRIVKTGLEHWHVEPARYVRPKPARNYFDVQVIAHSVGDHTDYTFYCDHREFSSLQYGDEVYQEFTRHILQRRQGGERYPIYITDIDLPRATLGSDTQGVLQTIHFLNYKKQIEERLNRALGQLAPERSG